MMKLNEGFGRVLGYLLNVEEISEKEKSYLLEYFFALFQSKPKKLDEFLGFYFDCLKSKNFSKKKRIFLAKWFLQIISVVCIRFGKYSLMTGMQDFCFKLVEPRAYLKLNKLMGESKKESNVFMNRIKRELSRVLVENGYEFEIYARYKELYSVFRKLEGGDLSRFGQLKDIWGFRVVLKSDRVEDCYEVMNLFHNLYTPVVTYFKDYLAIPKLNGYRSLHLGLKGVVEGFDKPIEVQVRTKKMDILNEHGLSSHWLYYQDKQKKVFSDVERSLYSFILKNNIHSLKKEFVIVVLNKSRLIRIEKGANLMDLGFKIHTGFGERVNAAYVNGVEEKFEYILEDFDLVEYCVADSVLMENLGLKVNLKSTKKKITELKKKYEKKVESSC